MGCAMGFSLAKNNNLGAPHYGAPNNGVHSMVLSLRPGPLGLPSEICYGVHREVLHDEPRGDPWVFSGIPLLK